MEDFTGLVDIMESNFKVLEDDMVVMNMAMNIPSPQIEGGAFNES